MKKITFFILFFSFFTAKAQVNTQDSLALLALYNSTDGANWTTTWNLNNPVGSWHGVTTTNGRVVELDFFFNNLNGSIPSELGNLTALTSLSLSLNDLTGSIPSELGNLTALTNLNLSINLLTGSIPSELGNLTALTNLSLSLNDLTGSIPSELGNLTALTNLNLSFNDLTGSIPSELGNLTALTSLNLSDNQLTGSIPTELGNLTALTFLNLQDNQLTGSIPTELGNLTALIDLYLQDNQLTGSIPTELGNLTALIDLYLQDNQLTGSIPTELGNLTALTFLNLNDNQLTGSIPTELGNLTALTNVDLSLNLLTGSIPSELGNLSALTNLDLSDNQFTGSILSELGNLTALTSLNLNDNQLTDLPDLSHITGLNGSTNFQVQNNFLDFEDIEPNRANLASASNYSPQGPVREGQIYSNPLGTDIVLSVAVNGTGNVYQWFLNGVAIGGENNSSLNLTNIQEANFGLYYCEITNPNVPGLTLRSLPDIIGNPFLSEILTSDYYILLNLYNSTNGAGWNTTWDLLLSPTNWDGITLENQRVVAIDLANNNLLGTLASDLGLLDSLQTLDLGTNELSGVLPAELGNLAALTTLDLGTNELSGVLPAELGNLSALTTLDLGTNELSGALPNTLANLTNLLNLKLENNAFTGLSDLTALTQLIVFSVQNNQLDFGDLQPNIAVLTVYSPQKPVREGENYTLVSGSNLMLSVDVDGTGNIYQWFYNSNPIANASNSSLDLMDLQTEESGLYYCEISNPNVPSLILTSLPDNLTVVPNAAPTGIALSNNSIEENLAIGTLIGLLSTTDSNPTDEHTYTISDNTNFQISADSLYANISFDYETIESYNLTVTSTDLGGLTYSDDLIISIVDVDDDLVTAIEDVFTQTEIVLYPNPSTNFLHIRGLKKIGVVELLFYNLQGQIVKEYSEIQDVYDVSDLPKGFYIALIKTLNFEKTINFIIN